MRDLILNFCITEDKAAMYEGRNAMVVPLSDTETTGLRDYLNGIDAFTRLVAKALSTLDQVIETKGCDLAEIEKTLARLREPARGAVTLSDQVRKLLGRAIFVGPMTEKGTLQ